ncbi:DUF2306 domain-containing protein [Piscinibacter sakaiensis]|uniref:DUF2306 domain-containing protein n=1 Tax=Piscinibacter sakaiensis TaxID=1547922 RepID=UPI003AABBB26
MRRFGFPQLLLVLSVVPILGGVARLHALAGAGDPLAFDRFALDPWPVVLHIVSASIYCILGAFQFDERLRQTQPARHRNAGRVAVAFGFVAALSGLWMTLVYAIPPAMQGELLFLVRMLVGGAMAGFLLLGIRAILNGDLRRHRAWMVRAYALAQGAGTQVVLLLPPALLLGSEVTGRPRDLLMVAAWLINVTLAELYINKGANPIAAIGLRRTGQRRS